MLRALRSNPRIPRLLAVSGDRLNVGRINRVRYAIHLSVQIAHSGKKGTIRLVEAVDDPLVGVLVRSLRMRIIGIVVLILEPVPSDASVGGEQSQDKVLVKEAAVILGMNEPACAGVIKFEEFQGLLRQARAEAKKAGINKADLKFAIAKVRRRLR